MIHVICSNETQTVESVGIVKEEGSSVNELEGKNAMAMQLKVN